MLQLNWDVHSLFLDTLLSELSSNSSAWYLAFKFSQTDTFSVSLREQKRCSIEARFWKTISHQYEDIFWLLKLFSNGMGFLGRWWFSCELQCSKTGWTCKSHWEGVYDGVGRGAAGIISDSLQLSAPIPSIYPMLTYSGVLFHTPTPNKLSY